MRVVWPARRILNGPYSPGSLISLVSTNSDSLDIIAASEGYCQCQRDKSRAKVKGEGGKIGANRSFGWLAVRRFRPFSGY